MKSLALYVSLSLLISFSLQSSYNSNNENLFDSETPCESKCLACQQTVYNLKFHQTANCKKNHCRSTCYKVQSEWNAPGSVFSSFQSDSLGKCEVCFRAGYCSMSECQVQKNFEISVINSVVDKASLNGIVDDKNMKDMLKKIMNNQAVNFKKIAKKVQANIKKASKFINKKAEKKLLKAVNLLNSGNTASNSKTNSKNSKAYRGLSSSKLIKIIRESLKKFRLNISSALNVKKNKKLFLAKKKEIKKQYNLINASFKSFINSFARNIKLLESTQKNFSKKVSSLSAKPEHNEALDNLLKAIGESIKKIKNENKEANDALESLKKLYDSLK